MLGTRHILSCTRPLITVVQKSIEGLTCTKSCFERQYSAIVYSSSTLPQALVAQKTRLYTSRSSTTNSINDSANKRIYYGSLAPRMKAVKVFSLTTSLAGLAAQPVLLEQGMKMGGTPMAVFFCGFAGFFTFVTPLLLHFITKKYVTEIHYNPAKDEYTAITISLLLYKIITNFKTNDVKVPEVPGMFTSFLVHNKPLFVDPSLFEEPEHYVRIMGYDKPVDLKLEIPESTTKVIEKDKNK